ncbi:MAG: hypothetical protein PVF43_10245 [Candidatus Eiseniibacteriota bacterium]|jgi:hypothetical protein
MTIGWVCSIAGLALEARPVIAQPHVPALRLEIEGAALWQGKNDVQIPNDAAATRFSAIDVTGNGPFAAGRATLTWQIGERHALRLLAAPLTIRGTETLDVPIDFAGSTFAAGRSTDATYRFNSWRLTYSYRFFRGDRWTWQIGFTAKIRDAEVALAQEGLSASDTDVGFVPLLHLAGDRRLDDRWRVELDLDALAGGPGRAIDLALRVRRHLSSMISVTAGYRTIEGGADVDEVYNFAWLHYAVASIAFDLR